MSLSALYYDEEIELSCMVGTEKGYRIRHIERQIERKAKQQRQKYLEEAKPSREQGNMQERSTDALWVLVKEQERDREQEGRDMHEKGGSHPAGRRVMNWK